MAKVVIDTETDAQQEHPAIIFSPRRNRQRYPEAVITLMEDDAAALAAANVEERRHPARVYGPSSSSEGLRLYYLVRWLDEP